MQELSGVPGRGSVEDALVLPKAMRVSLLFPHTITLLANFLKFQRNSQKK